MITSLFRAFHAGPRCGATRPLRWMGRVARKGLASSGALAGLVTLVGSAALPAPAAGQGDFECDAGQVEESFGLTGQVEQWDVPPGVDSLGVIAAGGRGQTAITEGGTGALVAGTFPVTPGATLRVIVAGQGGTGDTPDGGAGGGGGGGSFVGVGGFSGELLLVAGGGGGSGGSAAGGDAGLIGKDGGDGGGEGGGKGGSGTGTGGSEGCEGNFCGGGGGGASAGSDGVNGNVGGGGGAEDRKSVV